MLPLCKLCQLQTIIRLQSFITGTQTELSSLCQRSELLLSLSLRNSHSLSFSFFYPSVYWAIDERLKRVVLEQGSCVQSNGLVEKFWFGKTFYSRVSHLRVFFVCAHSEWKGSEFVYNSDTPLIERSYGSFILGGHIRQIINFPIPVISPLLWLVQGLYYRQMPNALRSCQAVGLYRQLKCHHETLVTGGWHSKLHPFPHSNSPSHCLSSSIEWQGALEMATITVLWCWDHARIDMHLTLARAHW